MPTTKHWTTEPDGELMVKTTLSGPASVPPSTVNEVFKRVSKKFAYKPALRAERDGEWKTWTFQQYYADVAAAAKSLIRLGLERFHGVCILGFNAPEWFIAYLSGIMAGGIACGIYTTNNPEACHFIADNCSANVVFCENKLQLTKILQVRDRLPHLKAIVQYSPEPVDAQQRDEGVMSWAEFMEIGHDVPDYEVQWRIEQQKPGHCASLIYTSGTTGQPKGVMISHDNVTWTASVCGRLYQLSEEDHMISYLPLSHIAAQMMDINAPLHCGLTIHFARPDALKGTLLETLKAVRPTVLVGVPRVWEKFKEKVEVQLSQVTGLKEVIMSKARSVGRQTSINKQSGRPAAWGYWLANTFVFKNLREKMGLERCRVCGSAAAPISRSVLEFFLDFDIPIYELYGMSESSGPQTLSLIGHHKTGSTGKVMAGAELKIDNPGPNGDGEVLFRGRHVFMGYLKEERKTQEAIDEDGWLHSGDIGRIDPEGYLYITGRIKEILITRGGENIAPVPIEEQVLDACKLLSYCIVIGDSQRYITALVSLRCDLSPEAEPLDQLDALALSVLQEIGSTATTGIHSHTVEICSSRDMSILFTIICII
ncbi:Long-chain-fatty-acid--CoA ligase ACSBG2 [Geodia barretti]|uniref:long-chain-fatty-acid--CoA ligase n=1 Tax=Geodia barretti TaxID=519541 RepID=A0AA35S5H6_GEOBA|nr:Long-chain-fatty-acid--CoA ligase ACSBG2 [Geodia barretti]